MSNHEEQKDKAWKDAMHHLKHGSHFHPMEEIKKFVGTVKDLYNEQREVSDEYEKGESELFGSKKGKATKKAEEQGKYYHPFTGLTY